MYFDIFTKIIRNQKKIVNFMLGKPLNNGKTNDVIDCNKTVQYTYIPTYILTAITCRI